MVRSFVTLLVLMAAASSGNAVAQAGSLYERPTWFVGYVANAPHLLLGGTVAALPPRLGGWGLYLDAKTGIDSPANEEFFRADISFQEGRGEGHTVTREESHWRSYNAALVRAFGDEIILYLGGGAAEGRVFAELLDESGETGNFGYYFVEDETLHAWYGNVMGGMYFRLMKHVAVQAGLESTPTGLTVGVIAVF